MQIPSCCPHCDAPFSWEVDLSVERELAWAAPNSPAFLFRCASCGEAVRIRFDWRLERGTAPRALLLVEGCPHGCGARLGLRLEPDDPWALGTAWPDEDRVLGGYRCPRCDGEGRLVIRPVVEAAGEAGK